MTLKLGNQVSTQIGYFVVRESEGTSEIEVQDAPPFETRSDAKRWIDEHGMPGVDYWICCPINTMSIQKA